MTERRISEATKGRVRAALPAADDRGWMARQVHAAVEDLSHHTIRAALRALVVEGRAQRSGRFAAYRYRLAGPWA